MTWMMWRQHRKQALVALIGLAVLAAVLVPTGMRTHDAVAAYRACVAGLGTATFVNADAVDHCSTVSDTFTIRYEDWAYPAVLLLFLPLLVGLFWGAPLIAREIEQGTHRLVWTQGISRRRWALTKIGVIAASVAVFGAAYAVLISWWMEPLNGVIESRLGDLFFDMQGVAPVGYVLFAVAVGALAGTVTRKVLPAMATTLVAFLAVRIAVAWLVRPNIREPLVLTYPVGSATPMLPNPALGNWQLSSGVYAADGTLKMQDATSFCRPGPGSDGPCQTGGDYNAWTVQPGDRFWLFQWVEVGLFVALSALLLYAALWQVRRRIA